MVLKAIVDYFFGLGVNCHRDDPINHPYARATKPDDLIAANIIQSFASEFDKWVVKEQAPVRGISKYWEREKNSYSKECFIQLVKDELTVWFNFTEFQWDSHDQLKSWQTGSILVNGLSLVSKHDVYKEFLRLQQVHKTAQRVAAEERRKMEENEKKWNLAEQLLGMKRTPSGALIAATDYKDLEENA